MMATIIPIPGGFIAGDPDTTLHDGNHWCDCDNGLDWYDGMPCIACNGAGQVECDDPECSMHKRPGSNVHA